MPHLSAEAKHHILIEYSPHDASRTFAALARRHAVKGGAQVIRLWHKHWDGTAASLAEGARAGRPRVLSRDQINRSIYTPLFRANRSHRAIHYTELLPRVRATSRTEISLRTVQRYGKEKLKARHKRGKKRCAKERQSQYTYLAEAH